MIYVSGVACALPDEELIGIRRVTIPLRTSRALVRIGRASPAQRDLADLLPVQCASAALRVCGHISFLLRLHGIPSAANVGLPAAQSKWGNPPRSERRTIPRAGTALSTFRADLARLKQVLYRAERLAGDTVSAWLLSCLGRVTFI